MQVAISELSVRLEEAVLRARAAEVPISNLF